MLALFFFSNLESGSGPANDFQSKHVNLERFVQKDEYLLHSILFASA